MTQDALESIILSIVPEKDRRHGQLSQQLLPALILIRRNGLNREEKFGLVKGWFEGHEQNLAPDITDLVQLCRLPDEERRLVTYPVIGNLFLKRVGAFKSQTRHQEKAKMFLMEMIKAERFYNPHTDDIENPYEHNRRIDELNNLLLKSPNDSMPLHTLIYGVYREVVDMVHVYSEKGGSQEGLSSDLGHGLCAPARHFTFLTWHISSLVKEGSAKPLKATIMVVDDRNPKDWYERLISVGFNHDKEQQGYFTDGESALKALTLGHYDVILSDLDLGKGKMRGEEFAKKAYRLQKRNGVKPLIHLFSDDRDALWEADQMLRLGASTSIIFTQPGLKSEFSAASFRVMVNHWVK